MTTGSISVSRRQAIRSLAAALFVVSTGDSWRGEPAVAESILESQVRGRVTVLLDSRQKGANLRGVLAKGEGDMLSDDDKEYLARAAAVWLAPAVDALDRLAVGDVDIGPGIEPLARVLPVHLAELNEERRAGRRSGVIQELDEYLETLEAVLKKEGLARFVAGKRWNGKEWTEIAL